LFKCPYSFFPSQIVTMLIPVTSRTRVKRSGISPLHLAAERNNDYILEELVEAGYDVNFTLSPERSRLYEDRRSSVLYFAVMNNNIFATELLLQAGANPNVDLLNPLLISIRHGCLKTMKLLLDHGANIDAYICSHPTTFPATIMFSMKYLPLLKFLMDLGCDANSCFKCQYGNGHTGSLWRIVGLMNYPQYQLFSPSFSLHLNAHERNKLALVVASLVQKRAILNPFKIRLFQVKN
uniref:Ankyrin repeat and SOCS box containing 2 n=1 Tax=Crocodylus porosus TaxID=8502 RepID=A0A7M4ENT0_CROPO